MANTAGKDIPSEAGTTLQLILGSAHLSSQQWAEGGEKVKWDIFFPLIPANRQTNGFFPSSVAVWAFYSRVL